jgi:hypothetical protein
VCDEEFTQRRTVTCPKCQEVGCKNCLKQYIEMSGTDACCINGDCKAVWTRRFLTENFSSYYLNGKYKKMIDTNRVDRVVATNSRFMEEAQLYKTMKEKKAQIDLLGVERKKVKDRKIKVGKEYSKLKKEQKAREIAGHFPEDITPEIKNLMEKNKTSQEEWRLCRSVLYKAKIAFQHARVAFQTKNANCDGEKSEKVIYQKACPQSDCNGFLSQKGVCGICKIHVCSKCNVVKGTTKDEIATHECKEEDVESVKTILKETKPCPRCGTRIHKIDGCDQMWCPYCQDKYGEGTAFSWKTGKIERGRIHNPHFIEHMQKRGGDLREVGDVHCGGLPQIWQFDRRLTWAPHGSYKGSLPRAVRVRVMDVLRRVTEINQYVVIRLRRNLREQNVHRMTQIKHIVGEISDKKFRAAISKTEKKREKDREVLDIFEVVVAVLTEKINHLYNEPNDENVQMFLLFVDEFSREENRCLADISFIYKQSVNCVKFGGYYGGVYRPSERNFRFTTKKELQHYKTTGTILQKKVKAKAKAQAPKIGGGATKTVVDLTNE